MNLSEALGAICRNVSPMRAVPASSAEQVSQAIFGETVRVRDNAAGHYLVDTPDGYSGWIREGHVSILETGERYPDPSRAAMVAPLFLPVFRDASGRSERMTLLTLGTVVELGMAEPGGDFYPIRFPNGQFGFVESSALIVPQYPPADRLGPNLVVVARGLIGVPYLWGGRTPFGIDCSGFMQRVYWLCGVTIPRDAYQQAEWEGFRDVPRDEISGGDLIFFTGEHESRRRITHVGMAQADGTFIHASGALGVAITPLDDESYDRRFDCARRIRH